MPPYPTVYSPVGDSKVRRERLCKRYDGLKKKIDALAILTGAKVNLRVLTTDGEATEYASDGWDLEAFIAALKTSGKEPPWAKQDRDGSTSRKKANKRVSKRQNQKVHSSEDVMSSATLDQLAVPQQMQGRAGEAPQAQALGMEQQAVGLQLSEFEKTVGSSDPQMFAPGETNSFPFSSDFGSESFMNGIDQPFDAWTLDTFAGGSSFF